MFVAAFLAAVAAGPAAAQRDSDGIMSVSATVAKPVRTAYRETLRVGMRDHWRFRALLLDDAIYTLPAEPGGDNPPTVMRVQFTPKGDSTTVAVSVVATDASGERRCTGAPCQGVEMLAGLQAIGAITARLDSVTAAPPTAAAADSLAGAGALGYSTRNAIRVGGGAENGSRNEMAWLDGLRGPGGETVAYLRLGSCCEFATPNGLQGKTGVLDAFEVTYPGLERPVLLYINMYDPPESAQVPQGFTRAPASP
ncbi:MAG TPA: hypothetical protein VF705_02025 [Longimicrobium sp.]